MPGLWKVGAVVLVGFWSSGCRSYRPEPLVPEDVVSAVEAERQPTSIEPTPFTFPRAAELMAGHGPSLKEARAEYQTALALAKIKTPLPNPALEIGPAFGFGPDVDSRRIQPFGSIGFTLPTAGKRTRQDELNRIQAELLLVEMLARHRELYLDLRRLYSQWNLSRTRVETRKEIAQSAEKSISTARQLVVAGLATSLDVGLLELEAARLKTETLNAERALTDVEGEMSETIGVQAGLFAIPPPSSLPDLPEAGRDLAELKKLLVFNHPELARLRARYAVAEAALRLEIARQYPDFQIGPSYTSEVGEKKSVLGLALGIEIPLFNRNQQGVAAAQKRREEVRAKYEAAANRALAALERAWRDVQISSERLRELKTEVLPKAEAVLDVARKSMRAGVMDGLRYLETERSRRVAALETLEMEFVLRDAWVGLEEAVGVPLVQFPGERRASFPTIGSGAEERREAGPVNLQKE